MSIDLSRKWKFETKNPRSVARDPIQGEFFNTEDIKDVSVALIRESFQNSLDSNVGQKIRIRVTVSGITNALSARTAAKYFGNYWDHLKGAYPSNNAEISEMALKQCQFVVIEDFNTTGLMGDEKAQDEPLDKKNDFYYFFRAEGKSGKSGNDKGRWGVGKYVYPKSSAAKAFFALTIRHEGPFRKGPLVVGRAVIKGHKVGETSYEPDGWFAVSGEKVYEPFDSVEVISEFRNDWRISRKDESGLSVVVPYIEDVNEGDLFRSVVEEYMLVIMRNELEVELVGSDDAVHILNSETLKSEAKRIFADCDELEEVLANIEVLTWAISVPDEQFVILKQIDSSPEWNSQRITEEQSTQIREQLATQGKVAVRIPVKIKINKSNEEPAMEKESFFNVIYVSDNGNVKAQFIREGIKVSGVKSDAINSLRAFVLIDNGVIATLLGDAEGPAHTDWSVKGREGLTKKYQYVAKWIDFVKQSPKRIIETARGADRDGDKFIAAGWFPDIGTEGRPVNARVEDEGSGDETPPTPPFPPPSKQKVSMSKVDGGFSLTLTEHGLGLVAIKCICAYNTRKGDPFAKWTLDDFDIKKMPIEVVGGTLTALENNSVEVAISDPEVFALHIRGFDMNRDIATTIRIAEQNEAAE
jgi:hypothetical protein